MVVHPTTRMENIRDSIFSPCFSLIERWGFSSCVRSGRSYPTEIWIDDRTLGSYPIGGSKKRGVPSRMELSGGHISTESTPWINFGNQSKFLDGNRDEGRFRIVD